MAFFTKLRARRLRLGLTQKQVGDAVGKTDKAISGYERGLYSPDHDIIHKLSQTLQIPIAEFYPAGADVITDSEILEIYRQIPTDRRSLAKRALKSFIDD